ncbi:MAG: hypothetical protein RDV48_28125 [Candidatus Eremiobacteraeota bacterium]|nr:hypothetical protein [Candidatus Eremiobacteraeota bacterium]
MKVKFTVSLQVLSLCLIFLCSGAYAQSGRDPGKAVTLPVTSKAVTIISSVPSCERGSEVKAFSGAFRKLSAKAHNGSVSVQAGREPVFISDGDTSLPGNVPAEKSPFGFHPANVAGDRKPFGAAEDIGIRWHRGFYAYWIVIQRDNEDIEKGRYHWVENDREWGAVPPSMTILANIGLPERLKPNPVKAGKTGAHDRGGSLWQLNEPEEAYLSFVKAAVDRYDGDGKNDMPGLKVPIKYWQFENEPDLRGNSDWEGFAHLQEITYKAIKKQCPAAKVMMGGQSGGGIETFDAFYAPILKKLGGRFVDIYDFHYYGDARLDWRGVKKIYDHIRKTLDSLGYKKTEIWITEMGSYSGAPGDEKERQGPRQDPHRIKDRPQTEREQARDVVKRYVYPLALGVKKVFWAFGLMEGFKHDDGYFDHTGFIYDGEFDNDPPRGTKKLSYYTFKLMTQTLEGADWDKAGILDLAGNVYAIRVPRGKGTVTILWYDPPYAVSECLPPEKIAEIRKMLSALEEEKTDQSNAEKKFARLFRIIRIAVESGGPGAVNSWAPKDKVTAIERKIRERKADAVSDLDGLIRKAVKAFQ